MTKTQCIGQLAHRCGEYGTIPQYTEKTRRNNAASTHSHEKHIIRCATSEGAGAEATSSETSGRIAAAATGGV